MSATWGTAIGKAGISRNHREDHQGLDAHWPSASKPPAGAPNILIVLFDDVGFSDFGCYGSPIATPAIDAIAARGLRYTGFHTTAMCSTTRAALLTGRNHHSVGMGCLANFDSGYPGYRGKIAREAGTLAEMLRPHGYRNYMIGKWHVTPVFETGPTGPFDGWPLARGFDRYYGFMDAETDQYAPELVLDNTHIDPPGTYETGYHLTPDLIDQSIKFHRRSHRRRTAGALAHMDRARRLPRPAPGAPRPDPEVRRAVPARLGRRARAPPGAPDRDGRRACRYEAAAAQRRRRRLGDAVAPTREKCSAACRAPMPPCSTMPTSTSRD